jgi:flagellar FliL protein
MAEAELNPAATATAAAAAPGAPGVEGEEAPAKKSKLPLIIAIVVVLVLIGGGVGGWMWYSAKKKKEAEEAEQTLESRLKAQMQFKKENKAPTFVKMDPFTVNLPSKGGEHYLQVEMFLRVSEGKVEGKIKEFLPVVQDRIITVLSSRSMEQLATVEGKEILGKEIALVVNSIIEPQLTAIYVLQQQPSTADLRNLERIGAMPKDASATAQMTQVAREAAAQFWRISEMDLPVQGVLFKSFIMQ